VQNLKEKGGGPLGTYGALEEERTESTDEYKRELSIRRVKREDYLLRERIKKVCK